MKKINKNLLKSQKNIIREIKKNVKNIIRNIFKKTKIKIDKKQTNMLANIIIKQRKIN